MGTTTNVFVTHTCCGLYAQRPGDRLVVAALASCTTLSAAVMQPCGSVRTSARFTATT
jgi:hypothetical protein